MPRVPARRPDRCNPTPPLRKYTPFRSRHAPERRCALHPIPSRCSGRDPPLRLQCRTTQVRRRSPAGSPVAKSPCRNLPARSSAAGTTHPAADGRRAERLRALWASSSGIPFRRGSPVVCGPRRWSRCPTSRPEFRAACRKSPSPANSARPPAAKRTSPRWPAGGSVHHRASISDSGKYPGRSGAVCAPFAKPGCLSCRATSGPRPPRRPA